MCYCNALRYEAIVNALAEKFRDRLNNNATKSYIIEDRPAIISLKQPKSDVWVKTMQ